MPIKVNTVTVLSPHPDSELCSANFDKYLPWSLHLSSPYISIWISISTPGRVYSCSHATWRHGLQICHHRYPFVPGSREAMQCEVRALLRGTSRRTVKVLNPGLDRDPDPESCTLPLDQFAAWSPWGPSWGPWVLVISVPFTMSFWLSFC